MRTKEQALALKNKNKPQPPVKNDTWPRQAPVTGGSGGRK